MAHYISRMFLWVKQRLIVTFAATGVLVFLVFYALADIFYDKDLLWISRIGAAIIFLTVLVWLLQRMRRKIFILLMPVVVWMGMACVDFICVSNYFLPPFSVEVAFYYDGGSTDYQGLGYMVKYHVDITPGMERHWTTFQWGFRG